MPSHEYDQDLAQMIRKLMDRLDRVETLAIDSLNASQALRARVTALEQRVTALENP